MKGCRSSIALQFVVSRSGRPHPTASVRGIATLERLREARRDGEQLGPERIAALSRDLGVPRARAVGLASYYDDLSTERSSERHLRPCAGTACFAATGGSHLAAVSDLAVEGGDRSASTSVQPVHCLGYCYAGPAALDGEQARSGSDLVEQLSGRAKPSDPEIPFVAALNEPVVLAGLSGTESAWQVWPQVARAADRAAVIGAVSESQLRGRGGAGFPAAVKWNAAAEAPASGGPRHLICNGDEGDPGAFVDRLLMERDPARVLEGMALAALASRSDRGHVYVRSEYPRAAAELERAITEARAAGHLGRNVHGGGIDFDVEVFRGVGSYVAGEETSLIASMEGRRGEVRPRPPFPTSSGLDGQPTVVNNVETLSALPWIVSRGGAAYAALGAGASRGTKVVCLSATFTHPGAYEIELGTSLREVVEGLGGGLADGEPLRAVQVGGPLGGFLAPTELDVPITFEDLLAAGVDLGHGSLIAIGERIDPPELLAHIWGFVAAESCGACAPCRLGSARGLAAARELAAGGDGPEYGSTLETMRAASLCAFGRGVPGVIRSLERVYPELAGGVLG